MYKPTTINRHVDNAEEAKTIAESEGYGFQGLLMLAPGYYKINVIPLYQGKVPGCKGCEYGYGPMHYPSDRCESGKRPHCSCDTCF